MEVPKMQRNLKLAAVLAALLVAFVAGMKSQSPPAWRVVSTQLLPDGPNIMEVQNTLTLDSYVMAWNASGVAIVPKAAPSAPTLLLPPMSPAREPH
jgi:hypothetical protein